MRPKGKPTYEVLDEREATEEAESRVVIEKKVSSGTDMEARWIKKGGILRCGYKKHVVTDEEGLGLGALTTAANVNEITNIRRSP